MLMRFLQVFVRLLGSLAAWLVALVVLFEEWGWAPLQRLLARMGNWPGLHWLEEQIRALPPWAALATFGLPTLALLPVKLMALWAIGSGHVVTGSVVVVVAKLVGTGVVARLFSLTKPALMQLAWFARIYQRWTVLKMKLLAQARSSWPWRAARVLRRRVRRLWRRAGTP